MKTSQYIDLIKENQQLALDKEVAEVLKVKAPTVVSYRKNEANFGPETCMKVAELTGIPGEKIAADMMAARAKDRKTRQFWEKLGAKVAPHSGG